MCTNYLRMNKCLRVCNSFKGENRIYKGENREIKSDNREIKGENIN